MGCSGPKQNLEDRTAVASPRGSPDGGRMGRPPPTLRAAHGLTLAAPCAASYSHHRITDSVCKNQLVVVNVQYGPFNTYIPIRSTTIGKSRVAKDPIAMHTSWRSNSDIASVTSIGYPCKKTSGESSTTKHRLLHASGPHPIPPPNDPKKSHSTKSSSHAQHIELSITDSACKNQLVVVSVQYGPFNPYIPIRSTTIGKSRVAKDPIAMRTSWRSNSDIASVTSIGYPRMSASGESSTTMHRLLHASGSHPIPPPNDPKTNQYNQDLRLIHSTNGNHLESPNEGSSIDHQAAVDRLIRSTTGNTIPPSVCTRISDRFWPRTESPRKSDRNRSDHTTRGRRRRKGGGREVLWRGRGGGQLGG
ncbi:hypothetical protein F511_31991 [Dorcoceras hygrometricum]|uniref:Uncharacterized protein n=1 Tax=Dorcoceras hygrometricum TaxID=472368 RepID=A0A2Z7CJ52_9LAMI|nr:hypothetical protein F511_31991 [Dorcoceras hygrometricum]